MQALLFIPWFRQHAWEIPIPWTDVVLPLYPFGILVATGVLLGMKVSETWGKRNGISPVAVSDMVGHVVIGGFAGAMVLNTVFYHPERLVQAVQDPSSLFRIWPGLSSFGGYVGAILGLLLWWRRRRISPITVGEAACFGFPFAWIFGRSGCFVAHDHPGLITDFPLAVADYHVGYPPFSPRHDLGLYEVFWALGASALFAFLARKKRRRGFYMALLPLIYAPVRFYLDSLRAGPAQGGDVRYASLTPGQWGSIVLLAIGLGVLWWIRTHEGAPLPAELRWPPEDEDGAQKGGGSGDAGDEERAPEAARDGPAGEPEAEEATGDEPDEGEGPDEEPPRAA